MVTICSPRPMTGGLSGNHALWAINLLPTSQAPLAAKRPDWHVVQPHAVAEKTCARDGDDLDLEKVAKSVGQPRSSKKVVLPSRSVTEAVTYSVGGEESQLGFRAWAVPAETILEPHRRGVRLYYWKGV